MQHQQQLSAAQFVQDSLMDVHKIMAPFLNPPQQQGQGGGQGAPIGAGMPPQAPQPQPQGMGL
jgi:hypothetical protein